MGRRHYIQKGEQLLKGGEYLEDGTYLSPVIFTSDFKGLVLSWNCETPGTSSIKIDGRVRLIKSLEAESTVSVAAEAEEEPEWSEWLSWGRWGNHIKRGSLITEKEWDGVRLNVDTLEIIKPDRIGDRFQFRITFEGKEQEPKVKLVAENLLPVEKKHGEWEPNELGEPLHRILDVPVFSQMRRDPYTARVMCSATCCAMVLNYYGFDVLPEEAAWGLKDFDYGEANCGFGNWSFNAAYLGSQGFESYVKSMNLRELKEEIKMGRPTPVSVAYSNKPEEGLQYIPGAPTRTPGHIIVVCGFTHKNGKEYVVVNDPAAQVNQGVRRHYPVDQFMGAWDHSNYTAYVAIPDEELIARRKAPFPLRQNGELKRSEERPEILELFLGEMKLDLVREEMAVIMYRCHDCEYCEYIEPENVAEGLLYECIQWERKSGPMIFIKKTGQVIVADLR